MKRFKMLSSVLCAVGSVVMLGSVRTVVIAALAPESGVRLYTETNHTGISLLFSPGETYNVTLQPAHKNTISSLTVPEGFEVTLIDADGSPSQSLTFGAGEHASVGERLDNRADRVVVTSK